MKLYFTCRFLTSERGDKFQIAQSNLGVFLAAFDVSLIVESLGERDESLYLLNVELKKII